MILREGIVPLTVHAALEYVIGVALVAAPFVLGIVGLLLTIGTRFVPDRETARR